MTAPSASLEPGTLLASRYRVRRELGRGGMGIVYLCTDVLSGAPVAVKRLHRADAQPDAEDIWWFQQEARAVASLDHPAIVRGRDFGILQDGTPFLVMDVAKGRSLLAWLEIAAIPWPWPFTVLWSFVDQILAGLAHAHARGIIHADLKPTNLMIDFAGPSSLPKVQLLDLGLASLVRDTVDHRLAGGKGSGGRVVRAGAGTPGWMAPEQIRRATTHYGPPTDLYALGSILYHLVSGREPFTGTPQEVLEGHRKRPVPNFSVPERYPPEVGPFIKKLLAKRPWRRYEYAADAGRAWNRLRPTKLSERWNFRVPVPPSVPPERQVGEQKVVAEIPAASTFAPGLLGLRPSPLVAREEQRIALASIVERLCTANEPRKELVILSGEAGVGKTRLAEWLCELVHERGYMVPLRSRYRRIPAALDGIRGAVNAHFGLERADRELVERTLMNCWEVEKSDDEGRTWVAATAEWLRPTPAGTLVPLGPSGKRFFFDTPEVRTKVIIRTLRKLGHNRPVLLFLDDLHHASPGTFVTLAKLREQAPELKMLLVATVRKEALAADPAASARIEDLREFFEGRVIDLLPLRPKETKELLLKSLPLDDAAVETAVVRSKGNPLFALQQLHAWAGANQLELADGRYTVPPSALRVRAKTTGELWEERLAAIPEELRGSALAAAALGGDFPPVVLRALLAALEIPVRPAMEALHGAEILLSAGPTRLRWPHALLQEHLLARLLAHPDAKLVFRAAADALTLHPAAGTRRLVGHRVTNLLRAGDKEAAIKLVLGFVEKSWKRVRDVNATLNDLGRLDGIVTGRAAAAYARWRAEALRHKGDFAAARELAEQARGTFAALGDVKNEAHCLRLLGHIRSEQAIPEGRVFVEAAMAKFQALDDQAGMAECELVLGEIDYLLGEHDRARQILVEADRRTAIVGDVLGRGQCLILLSLIEQADNHRERARELLEEARGEFESLGYRLGIAQTIVALGHLEHRHGDLDAAIEYAKAARHMMKELANPRGKAACDRLLSMALLDSGQYEAARERALSAASTYDQLKDPWGQVEAALLLAQTALASGNPIARDLVHACGGVGLGEAEPKQHLALTQAWLAHVEGRFDDAIPAIEAARAAYRNSKRTGDHTPFLVSRLAGFDWPEPMRTLIDDWWRELGAF